MRQQGWELVLHQPDQEDVVVTMLSIEEKEQTHQTYTIEDVIIDFDIDPQNDYQFFKASVRAKRGTKKVYLSIRRTYSEGEPFNFNGPVISSETFRQSPHDLNAWIVTTIAEQAVPVIALKKNDLFEVAVSSSPYEYDNFTSQFFDLNNNFLEICSGDNGQSPGVKPDTTTELKIDYNAEKKQKFSPGRVVAYYHDVTDSINHTFTGLMFKSKASSLQDLRRDINGNVAACFSKEKFNYYFGAMAFTTAYMNLRRNETGRSSVWVVPSVEYANTQYGRDAFWISMMLSDELSAACLKHELAEVNHFAEYPLFTVIWAYRLWKKGISIDLSKVQAYVDAVEKRVKNNYYYSFTEADGRFDFQYWGDVMAFEQDDVITYNQGLFSLALTMAKEMRLDVKSDPIQAKKNYQKMFNNALGFYPISLKKNNVLGPDPLVADVLSQIYLNRKLLDRKTVLSHFQRLIAYSKTAYGLKIVATAEGEYLSPDVYDIPGYISQVNREKMPDGRYFRGGSYFLYDNLFLLDAYLHQIRGAYEELQWRTSLDFTIGGTTYESINTKTGEPWKPNMGWNVAIYALWVELLNQHRADEKLLENIDRAVE
jgi:hypothetical protein